MTSTTLADNKSLQRFLQSKGLYSGVIDGVWGKGSDAAARALLGPVAASWAPERRIVAVAQTMFEQLGFYTAAIDGLAGPASQAAREKWQDHITFVRPSPDPSAGVTRAPQWPLQRDCPAFYGRPGEPATGWKIVRLETPYPLYLDWSLTTKVTSIQIHEKCRDSAERAMKVILAHYGLDRIHELGIDQFGGSVAVRKMRNGSSWSMHAYGCALDFDADRNQLRETHSSARFARPEYAAFLDAWEAEGWISLGRARDFDWMHVQAARL